MRAGPRHRESAKSRRGARHQIGPGLGRRRAAHTACALLSGVSPHVVPLTCLAAGGVPSLPTLLQPKSHHTLFADLFVLATPQPEGAPGVTQCAPGVHQGVTRHPDTAIARAPTTCRSRPLCPLVPALVSVSRSCLLASCGLEVLRHPSSHPCFCYCGASPCR